jgi:hypothetical protein
MDQTERNPGNAAQRAWIARVLSVTLPETAGVGDAQANPAGGGEDIVGLWWDTKDAVNAQIDALRHAFLATGHPLAQEACEKGLGAFTGGLLARFQAAVIEYRNASPSARTTAATKLKRYADQLAGFVLSNRMLAILEANPFGVRVTIRRDVPAVLAKILALAGRR